MLREAMVRVRRWKELDPGERERFLRRAEVEIEEHLPRVREIVHEVREGGDAALVALTERFDGVRIPAGAIRVSQKEVDEAAALVEPEVREAIAYSLENIRTFHTRQLPEELWLTNVRDGVIAGEKVTPIDRVGLYVPRGKGSFPSVAMMLAAPAQVARVPHVVICTPPGPGGEVDPATLLVASLCAVESVFKVGGAQAIAALAYGTETIPRVAKIMGPGNIYVAAAKHLVHVMVDVGLPAGPSESIILADESADPKIIALDMLIEAEHGPDSASILVTHCAPLAEAVSARVAALLEDLPEPRRGFCEKVFAGWGGIVLTQTLAESIEVVNDYAPEHMEMLVEEPFAILGRVRNAGEILLGSTTPITLANFSIGANAILPTGGFARAFSPVSVRDYLKRSSICYVTPDGFAQLRGPASMLAEYEGFPAHAMAVRRRFQ